MSRILILGGTAEARELATELHAQGHHVITSLAGRVARPRLPVGEVRIGGFGGPEALAAWLHEHEIAAVVDATHPFAERISASAVRAAEQAIVPLVRLERPGWTEGPGDRWHWVDDLHEAAAHIPELGSRVLLTTGRQGLSAFAGVEDAWFLIRCVDPPDDPLPPHCEILLARGPYTLEGELALIDDHDIDIVVTKDSGGDLTRAKLDAARERGLPVIVVRRPPRPGVETVAGVDEAVAWVGEDDRLLPDPRTRGHRYFELDPGRVITAPAARKKGSDAMEAVNVHIGPLTFDHADYDAEGDVLYLHVGPPRVAEGEETPEGHVLRFEPGTDQIVGLTLVNARWLLDREGRLVVTVQEKVEASADELAAVLTSA